jgi:hypothetical protein
VRVSSENPRSGEIKHTTAPTSRLRCSAVDEHGGPSAVVPPPGGARDRRTHSSAARARGPRCRAREAVSPEARTRAPRGRRLESTVHVMRFLSARRPFMNGLTPGCKASEGRAKPPAAGARDGARRPRRQPAPAGAGRGAVRPTSSGDLASAVRAPARDRATSSRRSGVGVRLSRCSRPVLRHAVRLCDASAGMVWQPRRPPLPRSRPSRRVVGYQSSCARTRSRAARARCRARRLERPHRPDRRTRIPTRANEWQAALDARALPHAASASRC